jgi:predicted dehydrogenase
MGKSRVGVIGRTGRGNYGHRLDLVWKLFPEVEIAAVADEEPAGLKQAAERLGVRAAYSDYREMLRRERPDLVAIGVRYPDCHLEMVLAAVEAGARGIYLEKPMARTPAEADRMIEACEKAGAKLAVAHQMRISPAIELAKQRVAGGAIGRLLELRGRGKEDARAGGEDLVVLGTHVFDLMRQFAGDPQWCLARVTAAGLDIKRRDVREGPEGLGPIAGDAIAALFAFPGGLTGHFSSMRSDDVTGKRWGLDLYGSKGILTIRADMANPIVGLVESASWTGAPWTRLELPPRSLDEGNQPLVADLLDAIANNREPRASGRQARWTIEMAMAAYESQLTGGRAFFPLKNRLHPLAA